MPPHPQRRKYDVYGRPLPTLVEARKASDSLVDSPTNVAALDALVALLLTDYASLWAPGVWGEVTIRLPVENGTLQQTYFITVERQYGDRAKE